MAELPRQLVPPPEEPALPQRSRQKSPYPAPGLLSLLCVLGASAAVGPSRGGTSS